MSSMLEGCNSTLKICINKEKVSNIIEQLEKYTLNCSDYCFLPESKIIKEKYECIDNCYKDNIYKYEYNNTCLTSCPNGTLKSNENKYICEDFNISKCPDRVIIDHECIKSVFIDVLSIDNNNSSSPTIIKEDLENNIREEILNGNLDLLVEQQINDEKGELIIGDDEIKFEITTSKENNEYKNVSIISLGECENILKAHYNINQNESLLIFKTDIYEEGSLVPKIRYEVYDLKSKNQLDLSICTNTKIEILLPCIVDTNNEYKYNPSSDYYNDICYSYTTNDGTDIILSDRRTEYITNKMSLCGTGCEYKGYNSEIKKSKCECNAKGNSGNSGNNEMYESIIF